MGDLMTPLTMPRLTGRPGDNGDIARRIFEEVLNAGNLAVAAELIAPDFVEHYPRAGQGPGLAGFKQRVMMLRAAFPDIHYTIEDEICVADRVVVRVTAHGTHRGRLGRLVPTGKRFVMPGIVIFHLADGKITERCASYDNLGMLQQLGAIHL
jgi:steroid delta-isomerase-like uncharacterized protein